jgi:hypothetical protein
MSETLRTLFYVPQAHLSPAKGSPFGAGASARAYPCGAPLWPPGGPKPQLVLRYLDVENAPRYRRAGSTTYCNIYAHDFLHLLGLYIPRVWWIKPTRAAEGDEPVIYGTTVRELNANALSDWAVEWAAHFGWVEADEATVQAQVDASGKPGFVVARAPGRVGHIAIILPTACAPLVAGPGPLQSQAGARNRQVFRERWYANARHGYDRVRFYFHPTPKSP